MTGKRLLKIGERAASSLDTLQTSYDLARLAIENNVPGDFVECGVYQGAQCAAMAMAIMDMRYGTRRVHLFDSFSGVPAAGEHDKQWSEAGHPVGQSAATLDDVIQNMAEWGIDPTLLIYHEGPFDQTVASMMQSPIAILRLDGDLYESTKVCLEHLYPLVSPGGYVIFDDFALDGARKALMNYLSETAGYSPIFWRKP